MARKQLSKEEKWQKRWQIKYDIAKKYNFESEIKRLEKQKENHDLKIHTAGTNEGTTNIKMMLIKKGLVHRLPQADNLPV